MNSNAIRHLRRKKSTLTELKVAVVGAPGVGKSALSVRFLTRRYIGEYDHESECRYKQEVLVDGDPVIFEIADTCPKTLTCVPSPDTLQWADGFIFVYAITDRSSFNYILNVRRTITDVRSKENRENKDGGLFSVVLVANKGDMVHLRQVSHEEGEILAKDLDCPFSEVAASEQVDVIADVFLNLYHEVQGSKRRNKQSLLDRMLGNNKNSNQKSYSRGKSDSALPNKDNYHS